MKVRWESINRTLLIKKILLCFIGALFMGFGISINSLSSLGNDPISVLYNGIKVFLKIDLGMASNLINVLLLIIIFLMDKHYISIGTLIYVFTLGFFINLGVDFYEMMDFPNTMTIKIFSSIVGCLFLFLGVSLYIAINMGLDTWSGITMIVSKRVNIFYKVSKIIMDVFCLTAGVILGGTVGITTLVSAILGGPIIENFSKVLDKTILSWIKIDRV